MNAICTFTNSDCYARTIAASKRVRWKIEADVVRGRHFDPGEKFLPDGLSLIDQFPGLSAGERRFVSRIQGRTYANVFGLVERYIAAKVLELSGDYWLGDQVALEAMVRFGDEELKPAEEALDEARAALSICRSRIPSNLLEGGLVLSSN